MFTVFFGSALSVGLLLASNLLAVHASVVPRGGHHYKRDSSPGITEPPVQFAGALCKGQNGSFNSVSAIITVPIVTGSPGNAGAAFVILGDVSTPNQTALHAGIIFTVGSDNKTNYYVRYGYDMDELWTRSESNFDIFPGDEIQVTLKQASFSGYEEETVEVTELSGSFRIFSLFANKNGSPVAGGTASWVLGEFPNTDFPFGTVTFKNASTGPSFCDPGESTIENISNEANERITSATATNTSLTVQFGSTPITL